MDVPFRRAVLVSLLFVATVAVGRPLDSLEIAEWSGALDVERRGRSFRYGLVENLAVEPYDVIRTGADGEVVLRGTAEVHIGADSVVAVRAAEPVPTLSLVYGRLAVAALPSESADEEIESRRRLLVEAGMFRIPVDAAAAYGTVYRETDGRAFTTLAVEAPDNYGGVRPAIDLRGFGAIGDLRSAFALFDERHAMLRGERDYLDELMRREERSIGFPDAHPAIDELTRIAGDAAKLGLEIERMHRALAADPGAADEYRWVFARWGIFTRRAAAVRYMARVLDRASGKTSPESDGETPEAEES